MSLTEPGGLLNQLTKNALETALNAKLTEHLGHEHSGPAWVRRCATGHGQC